MIHVDPSKPFVLETDAFNFIVGTMFSKFEKDNLLHPIGFNSRKFSHVEINYKIHDKKILTIMDAFEEWHHLLEGAHMKSLCIQIIGTWNIS